MFIKFISLFLPGTHHMYTKEKNDTPWYLQCGLQLTPTIFFNFLSNALTDSDISKVVLSLKATN